MIKVSNIRVYPIEEILREKNLRAYPMKKMVPIECPLCHNTTMYCVSGETQLSVLRPCNVCNTWFMFDCESQTEEKIKQEGSENAYVHQRRIQRD